MSSDDRSLINRQAVIRGSLIGLQWIALTVGLGAIVVRSDQTFAGLIDGRIDSSWAFIAAFGFALLLGLSIASIRILIPAALLMCVGAVALFTLTLLAPTFDDTVLYNRALRNFAIDRAAILTIVLAFPATIGALAGYFLGALLDPRRQIYPLADEDTWDDARRSWWEARDKPGDQGMRDE